MQPVVVNLKQNGLENFTVRFQAFDIESTKFKKEETARLEAERERAHEISGSEMMKIDCRSLGQLQKFMDRKNTLYLDFKQALIDKNLIPQNAKVAIQFTDSDGGDFTEATIQDA